MAAGLTGTLFVVPTPIGNLEDMTPRAIRILKNVHLIAAEDTRHSRPLLTHFGITTRMTSYNQLTKRSKLDALMEVLASSDVALISDAGTPGIADPGFELIQAAIANDNRVEVLPGASSVITSVVLAGLPAQGFIFLGFLPRVKSHMRARMQQVAHLPYNLVIFEAPHRIKSTLSMLAETLGSRAVAAMREISKLHEEVVRGTLEEVANQVGRREPRGEWIVVVGAEEARGSRELNDLPAQRVLAILQREGMTARDAIGVVAEAFEVSKSQVYKLQLSQSPSP